VVDAVAAGRAEGIGPWLLPVKRAPARHPLTPAAVRVERARARNRRGVAEQMAVTVWFGEGPALPAPSPGGDMARVMLRLGAGVLTALALAAATGTVARLASSRELPALPEPVDPPRLGAGSLPD
jgi:hypothetical protein